MLKTYKLGVFVFIFVDTIVGDDILREKVNATSEEFGNRVRAAWNSTNIYTLFELFNLAEIVVTEPPNETLQVFLPSENYTVSPADYGEATGLALQPNVSWNCDNNSYYTLDEVDVDFMKAKLQVPLSNISWYRSHQWHLWLVVNIPGCNVAQGETLFEYSPPRSQRLKELHRVVFLVYKQPEKTPMKFDIQRRSRKESRHGLEIEKFADKHNFGYAVAGNFLFYYRTKR